MFHSRILQPVAQRARTDSTPICRVPGPRQLYIFGRQSVDLGLCDRLTYALACDVANSGGDCAVSLVVRIGGVPNEWCACDHLRIYIPACYASSLACQALQNSSRAGRKKRFMMIAAATAESAGASPKLVTSSTEIYAAAAVSPIPRALASCMRSFRLSGSVPQISSLSSRFQQRNSCCRIHARHRERPSQPHRR